MSTTIALNNKLVERFQKWSRDLQVKIDHLSRPMTQNPTPKRNREYQSRLHDARNTERLQKAFMALAQAHLDGSVRDPLASLVNKEQIASMVRKSTKGSSYYSIIEADDYSDTTHPARLLQEMIEGDSKERVERERLRKIGEMEAEIKLSKIPGFFPTLIPVVDLMLEYACIENGMSILEPSAGNGNIVDAIRKQHPGVFIDVCEVNGRLRDILKLKGYILVAWDFLEFDEALSYDRIVMNPPFENQQDMAHVRKAYSLLNENGVLVSVMAPSFEYRNDRKSTEFREWLDTVGATWENLPDGSFKQSGTVVSTRLLVIKK